MKLLKDESYFQENFRGFKASPPREIWLTYPELKQPTLGAIFFVLYYKDYFTKIFIRNESSTTTLINDKGGPVWVTVENDAATEKKP